MRMGRPKAELALPDEERSQLQSFARSRSMPAALCSRARIVLSSADGELNSSIAQRLIIASTRKYTARRSKPAPPVLLATPSFRGRAAEPGIHGVEVIAV